VLAVSGYMITYLVIGAIVLILLYVARWYLRRPPRYRRNVNDDLSKFFKSLLYDVQYPTGFLVIEAPNKKRFIQFARYQKGRMPGIQFDFPLAPWSENYYEKLNGILYDKGIDFETQATGEKVVVSFITVDLKQDWAKAIELAKLVLLEVFGLRPDDRIKVYLSK
jgi:hypothetical protein